MIWRPAASRSNEPRATLAANVGGRESQRAEGRGGSSASYAGLVKRDPSTRPPPRVNATRAANARCETRLLRFHAELRRVVRVWTADRYRQIRLDLNAVAGGHARRPRRNGEINLICPGAGIANK